jgi:hypothetical protein
MTDNTVCTTVQNLRKSLVFNVPGIRYTPTNPYSLGYTQAQLDMRRKAEILQYNKTSNGKSSKKQTFVTAVKGSLQRRTFSNYYLKAIQTGEEQLCPSDILLPRLTTASDVPGPAIYLNYDPTVPLYNYNSQQQAYGTQNTNGVAMWLTNYDTDVLDDNNPQIFTLNIQPTIDSNNYIYSFTTSVSLYISGFNTAHTGADVSGLFQMNIPPQNLSLTVMYGGQEVSLSRTPTITYSPRFLTDVSGYVLTRATANNFSGDIFMGNITFSNILLSTYSKNTYDFFVEYIPSYTIENIDNFSLNLKINRTLNSPKIVESGLKFSTPVSTDPVTTFGLTGTGTFP